MQTICLCKITEHHSLLEIAVLPLCTARSAEAAGGLFFSCSFALCSVTILLPKDGHKEKKKRKKKIHKSNSRGVRAEDGPLVPWKQFYVCKHTV